MTLAIITAWVVIGLVLGFFTGRDSWRNGNQHARNSWDRYPPHQTGKSIFWAVAVLVLWPFFAGMFAIFLLCEGVKYVFTSNLATRAVKRMWD